MLSELRNLRMESNKTLGMQLSSLCFVFLGFRRSLLSVMKFALVIFCFPVFTTKMIKFIIICYSIAGDTIASLKDFLCLGSILGLNYSHICSICLFCEFKSKTRCRKKLEHGIKRGKGDTSLLTPDWLRKELSLL